MPNEDNISPYNIDARSPIDTDTSIYEASLASSDTDKARTRLSMYNATVKAINEGEDPISVFMESRAKSAGAIKQQMAQDELVRKSSDIDSYMEDTLDADLSAFQKLVPQAATINQENEEEANKEQAPEYAVVDSMIELGEVRLEDREAVANNLFYRRHIGELWDSMGIMETVGEVAGLLLWPDESWDTSQVVGEYFSSAEGWNKYIQAFHTLPLEEQRKTFVALKDTLIREFDGNELKVMIKLMELLDPDSSFGVNVSQTLDKFALAGTLLVVGQRIKQFFQVATLARAAKNLGNTEKAAEFITDAINSPEAARVLETEQVEAAASGSPMKMEELLKGAPDGLSREVQANLQVLDEYLSETKVITEGLSLSEEEKAVAATKLREDLLAKPDVDNVEVLKWDDEGISVKYDVMSGTGTTPATVERKIMYTVDDVTGGFKQHKLSIAGRVGKEVFSPNFLFNRDRERLVDVFTRTMFASDIHRVRFNKALTEIIKPIQANKESMTKLDDVLLYGDETSQVFSYDDLVVNGINGIRLNDKEYRAYVGMRHMMDKAYLLKNKEMREVLEVQGLKNVFIQGRDEIMRPLDKLTAANASVRDSKYKTAYVQTPLSSKHSNLVSLTPELLKEYYDRGYVLAKAAKDSFLKVGPENHAKYALVKTSDISDLPYTVLNKKVGYIPREYKDGFYFVKTVQRGIVDGERTIVGLRTERAFSSKFEADNFATILRESMATTEPTDVRVLHDRQIAAQDFDKEVLGIHRGLYTSSRAADPLTFGIDGVEGARVSALDSISKYFTHLSSRMPVSKFRVGIMRRWINEAKNVGALPKNWQGDFITAIDDVSKRAGDLSPTVRDFLKKSHEQIQFQLRVPTVGEKEIESVTRASAEWLEQKRWFGAKTDVAVKTLHRFDHKDPISAIRSATFHKFLGVFNPVQYFIQAMGATIALSIDPQHFLRAMSKTLVMATLDNIHDPNMLKLHKAQIAGKIKDADVAEFYDLWRKTGLHESVISSNADLYSMAKSLPIGPGQIKRLFEKTKQGSLFFFKGGELFNRRYSFATAFEWWKANNKGRKIDKIAEKEILDRANTYMLRMSRANKARWQKGVLSIPTQFLQVHTKFTELLLGNEITAAEKTRLLLGQAALFGTAGVPFLTAITDGIASDSGALPGDIDEKTSVLVRGGLTHQLVQNYLGINVDVASRSAIGKGIEDAIMGAFSEKQSTHKMLFGAASGMAGSAYQAVEDLYNFGSMAITSGEDLPKATWKAALDSVLDVASSWDHASQAYELYNNPLFYNRKGDLAKNMYGENLQTIIAMGIGFRHRDLDNAYLLNMSDVNVKKRIANKAQAFVRLYLKVQQAGASDKELAEYTSAAWSSMILSEKNENIRKEIGKSIIERLSKTTTKEDTTLKNLLTNQLKGIYEDDILTNPLSNRYLGPVQEGEKTR